MNDGFEKDIRRLAAVRGGICLYQTAEALALVEVCRQKGVPVLGVDAFLLGSNTTQPLLEHSIDLSGSPCSHLLAKRFLEDRKEQGVYYEVVY